MFQLPPNSLCKRNLDMIHLGEIHWRPLETSIRVLVRAMMFEKAAAAGVDVQKSSRLDVFRGETVRLRTTSPGGPNDAGKSGTA